MEFENENSLEQTFTAIKYYYWKNEKFNIHVFLQPEEVIRKGKYTTKKMHNNKKSQPLPNQKLRLAKEDVYYENPKDAEK